MFHRLLTTKQYMKAYLQRRWLFPLQRAPSILILSPLSTFVCSNSSPEMWPLLPALPLLVLGSEFAILNEENDKNSSDKTWQRTKNGRKQAFWHDLLVPKCIVHCDWLTFSAVSVAWVDDFCWLKTRARRLHHVLCPSWLKMATS